MADLVSIEGHSLPPPLSTLTVCGSGPGTLGNVILATFAVELTPPPATVLDAPTLTGWTGITSTYRVGTRNAGSWPVGTFQPNQFGVPGATVSLAQNVAVTGVASAQSFGTKTILIGGVKVFPGGVSSAQAFGAVTFTTIVRTTLIGLGSAQSFGSITPRSVIAKTVTGIGTAQSFGTVTVKTAVVTPPGGVSSAQAFGTVTIKTTVKPSAGGVASAQAFGVPAIQALIRVAVVAVGSAQAFGAVTTRTGFTKPIGGVNSAQAFGVVQAVFAQTLPLGGVASAQSFGALTIKGSIKPPVGGVSSAQAFGTVHPLYSQRFTPAGIASAQAFGTTAAGLAVFNVWLRELDCVEQSLEDLVCIVGQDPPVLNEFVLGTDPGAILGGLSFQEDLDCIEAQVEAICDNPTICGFWVCGGLSFNYELDCLPSSDAAITNEFHVGDGTLVGGEPWSLPAPEPLVLDLQPLECV